MMAKASKTNSLSPNEIWQLVSETIAAGIGTSPAVVDTVAEVLAIGEEVAPDWFRACRKAGMAQHWDHAPKQFQKLYNKTANDFRGLAEALPIEKDAHSPNTASAYDPDTATTAQRRSSQCLPTI